MIAVIFILGSIFIGIMAALLNAYTITVLWGWFIEPLGWVLPTNNLVHIMGILLLINLINGQYDDELGDDDDGLNKLASKLAQVFVIPLVALLFGFVYTFFI